MNKRDLSAYMSKLHERFDSSYCPEPFSGCHLWIKDTSWNGYGRFHDGRVHRRLLAHHFSWERRNGPIPDGLCVLHKCDVRCCVNPRHLFLGTQSDNLKDAIAKGRKTVPHGKGEMHPQALLTESQVRWIRTTTLSTRELSNILHVPLPAIYKAKVGISWKHLK